MSEDTNKVKNQLEKCLLNPKPKKKKAKKKIAIKKIVTVKPKSNKPKLLKDPPVFTLEKQLIFLDELKKTCNVAGSARVIDVGVNTIYSRKKRDPDFAKLMEEAMEEAVLNLEGEAYRRAKEGVRKPVYYKGAVVGHQQEYSDTLMVTLLKGNLPEKYATNHNIELTGKEGGAIEINQTKSKLLDMLGVTLADIEEAEDGDIIEEEEGGS